MEIEINSSTWDCSHCYKKNNSINNFCKCLMSFYCIKCCKESNVNYTEDGSVICSHCGELLETIYGKEPISWKVGSIIGGLYLYADFQAGNRLIKVRMNVTAYNICNYFCYEIPHVNIIGENNICELEENYVIGLAYGFCPFDKPIKCGCQYCHDKIMKKYNEMLENYEKTRLNTPRIYLNKNTKILKIFKKEIVDYVIKENKEDPDCILYE